MKWVKYNFFLACGFILFAMSGLITGISVSGNALKSYFAGTDLKHDLPNAAMKYERMLKYDSLPWSLFNWFMLLVLLWLIVSICVFPFLATAWDQHYNTHTKHIQ